MESGRSKKVRSRRTPVAIWRVLCQERATFCEPGSTGCRSVTHPAHLGGPRAPHATAPFSHRGTRPSRRPSRTRQPTLPPATRAPESIQARTPPRAAKARRPRPSAPPRQYAPLCEHPSNIPEEASFAPLPPPRPNPSPSAASRRPRPRPAPSPATPSPRID